MSEDKTPGTAIAFQRERLIVQAPVAIWDTGDFEQMQRVAVVLARSGLVPETLCKEGSEWLPEAVIAARCTLVCNQARLWGADPLNVLQCTSLINGRLMYEGKLIAAVVASMTGVKLRYRFGVWNTDHIEFPEDESGLHGVGERLAVRCFDPDDPDRFVDGSVGQWKTTRKGNPWESPNAWPRQLRYRASREWARAYEPGVILGILADGDQDIDELVMEAKPVGLMQRLKGAQEGDGFDKEAVEAQTEKPKRRRKEPVKESAEIEHVDVDVSAEPDEHDDAIPAHMLDDDAPASVEEAQAESLTDRPTLEEADTETASAPDAEPEPATSEPVTDASADGPEASVSGPSAEAEDVSESMIAYIDAIERAAEWPEVVAAMRSLYATDYFRGLSEAQQNAIRGRTWDNLQELRNFALPDPLGDFTAFRLWIETVDDARALTDNFTVFTRQALWEGSPQFRAPIEAAVEKRLQAISEMEA